uniref:Uncharacterized protein n=1 Tax=viral metagenome TaxID=1070528 RepID=A0A6C0E861_9ZZZZ
MSNNTSVLDGTKIDLSKITFSSIKQNDNGSKSVRVSYNGGPLTIQTPMLHIPWNLSPPFSEKNNKKGGQKKNDNDNDDDDDQQQDSQQLSGRNKWSLQMDFRDSATDKKVKAFHDNMVALDALFLKKVVENRKEWFGDKDVYENEKDASRVYKKFYKGGVRERENKQNPDEKYPPCISPKVTCENGEFRCNCFNMNREKYDEKVKPMNKLQLKGSQGEGIIRLTNFYIQDGRCGPTWTLMRLRADESEGALSEFGFIDITDDDKDSSEQPQTSVEVNSSGDEDNGDVQAGDAEDDDEAVTQRPETPPPPPKQTTVTRKKKTTT